MRMRNDESNWQECIEYFMELIETADVDIVINKVDEFILDGYNHFAFLVAWHYFDPGGFHPDETYFTKYLNIAIGEENKLYDLDLYGSLTYENLSGLWVTGHQDDNDYIKHIENEYGIRVNAEDILRGYVTNSGIRFIYSEKRKNNAVPITTTFNEQIITKVASSYMDG